MREALIVWGGWSGHEPEKGAHIVADMLAQNGFKVHIEDTTKAFADPAIADMSLVVPIVTMSRIEKSMKLPPSRPDRWPVWTVDPVRSVTIGLFNAAALRIN